MSESKTSDNRVARLENEVMSMHISLSDAYDEIARLNKIIFKVRDSVSKTGNSIGLRKEIQNHISGEAILNEKMR